MLEDFDSSVKSVCSEVKFTYDSGVIARQALRSFPRNNLSITEDEASSVSIKAVRGYGECLCAFGDHFNIKAHYSIGYCSGSEYSDYNCGYGEC